MGSSTSKARTQPNQTLSNYQFSNYNVETMNDFYSTYPNSNFSNYQHNENQGQSSFQYNQSGSYRAEQHESIPTQPNTSTVITSQQSQLTSIWNPAVTATLSAASTAVAGNPNMLMDMGLKAGQTFLDQGTARMIPGLEKTMKYLRIYFAVNNTYVKRKMQRVLFSFFHRHWKRLESDTVSTLHTNSLIINYALPHSDDNAFDLYIPSMSLITYVLLCGLCYGAAGQFDPRVLQNVTTKCFLTQMFEVALMRLGFYFMQAHIDMMDLFAVTGYKYLGLCTNLLVGMLLTQFIPTSSVTVTSYKGYYVSFLWTATSVSYFMLKTMANNIPRFTAAGGPKREIMVLAFSGSQFATMWFLGQTKFLK